MLAAAANGLGTWHWVLGSGFWVLGSGRWALGSWGAGRAGPLGAGAPGRSQGARPVGEKATGGDNGQNEAQYEDLPSRVRAFIAPTPTVNL